MVCGWFFYKTNRCFVPEDEGPGRKFFDLTENVLTPNGSLIWIMDGWVGWGIMYPPISLKFHFGNERNEGEKERGYAIKAREGKANRAKCK